MGRLPAALLITATLAACATPPRRPGTAPPVVRQPPVAAPPRTSGGLEAVLGRNAGALIALFGSPGLDDREGPARKLQFLGPTCVLDLYLYPPRGGGDAVVTHVDARLPDGRDTDRAGCIEALSRR